MRKIYKFEENDNAYLILLDDIEIYTVSKDTLKVDGNRLYDAFFKEYSTGDIFELIKGDSLNQEDKLSNSVYNTINKLINEVCKKIDEQNEQ